MKLKRSKAYRKLMHAYQLNFGFREPYQVLLDSSILEDAARFKIDLVARLEGVLQGKIKPMVTTCCMRHLYNAVPKNEALIKEAKEYERRRCNHHELEDPLSSLECLDDVVDHKDNGTNKHRYVVASDDPKVRAQFRKIPGVPLIYISKSVMILEPMNTATGEVRDREEKSKFKLGLKTRRGANAGEKRKRNDDEDVQGKEYESIEQSTGDSRPEKKKKRSKGPKAPNPLSVKKSRKALPSDPQSNAAGKSKTSEPPVPIEAVPDGEESEKRKRKRRHKSKVDSEPSASIEQDTSVS